MKEIDLNCITLIFWVLRFLKNIIGKGGAKALSIMPLLKIKIIILSVHHNCSVYIFTRQGLEEYKNNDSELFSEPLTISHWRKLFQVAMCEKDRKKKLMLEINRPLEVIIGIN